MCGFDVSPYSGPGIRVQELKHTICYTGERLERILVHANYARAFARILKLSTFV